MSDLLVGKPKRFVKIDGSNGEFEIAAMGRGREDDGSTYVYRDAVNEFSFRASENVFSHTVRVWNVRPLGNVSDINGIGAEDRSNIESNLTYLYRSRSFYNLKQPIEPDTQVDSVQFNWGGV
jgi:hypothetical protein